MFVHPIWKLKIPLRLQNFMCLFSKIKLLTKDNLVKRRLVVDQTCLFSAKQETIIHLFLDCCVASMIWSVLSEIIGVMCA
jgi:hypothetical protein